jgi:hypothetical protein
MAGALFATSASTRGRVPFREDSVSELLVISVRTARRTFGNQYTDVSNV